MSFFNKILSDLFGNKSQRDIKEVMPVIQLIKQEYPLLRGLSNDELRAKADGIRGKIREYIKNEQEEILTLKEQAESGTLPLEDIEKVYERVDKLEEIVLKKIEEILNEVLPPVFAIVKETEVLTDCQEVFKEIIEKNSNGKYEIPRDLILKFLPQKVVDNFLDSLSDFTSEEINWVLEEIKNGNLTIICDDKGLN